MTYTPVEIRHVKLRRGLLGYKRRQVDRLLEEVIESFETVWRERADHSDRVEHLETELTRHSELEGLLRTTLVSAERAAHELKAQAKREAETILFEAQAEARAITRAARSEREMLAGEAQRLRLLLRAALGVFDEAAAATVEHAPTREHPSEEQEPRHETKAA
jgi:cell division initiation protein